jgi:hypothetical protein
MPRTRNIRRSGAPTRADAALATMLSRIRREPKRMV